MSTMTDHPKPDFIGLGAQKAATSWMHACLYEHPEAYLPASKEIHFFSRHYDRGASWYAEHFVDCGPNQVAGEISPTYLYDVEAPPRIYKWNPAAKLIVCLRNPIERAISAYRYEVKMGLASPDKTLEEALASKPAYLEHGLYHAQIARYLQYYPAEQILITFYEDITSAPVEFMSRVYQFLRIDPAFRATLLNRRVNPSGGAPRSAWIDRSLRSTAHRLRRMGFERAVWKIARSGLGETILRANRKKEHNLEPEAKDRTELANYFRKDVTELEALSGRPLLSEWLGLSVESDDETQQAAIATPAP